MKWASCLVLAAAATAGCVQFPLTAAKKTAPLAAEAPVARTPVPVTAEQVNELNARSKAMALQEELNRAAAADSLPEKPAPSR